MNTKQQLDRELSTQALIRSRIAKYDSDYRYWASQSKRPDDKAAQEAHKARMNSLREQTNLSSVNLQVTLLEARLEEEKRGK